MDSYYFLHTHLPSKLEIHMIPPNLLHLLREHGTDPACSKRKVKNWEQNHHLPCASICHMGVPNTNHVSILGPAFPNACWAFVPPSFACRSILMPCWQTPHVKFVFRGKNNSMTCWWSRDSRWIHGNVLVASSCVSSEILLHHWLLPCFHVEPQVLMLTCWVVL